MSILVHLPIILSAVAVPTECTSDAASSANSIWRSHRTVRKMAVSLEQGALDNLLLDAAQTSMAAAADSVRAFRIKCGLANDKCSGVRVRCACRALRFHNMTQATVRRLDDLAAGVLFGDSEQNMLLLTNAAPEVMDSLKHIGEGLEQYERRCGRSGQGRPHGTFNRPEDEPSAPGHSATSSAAV